MSLLPLFAARAVESIATAVYLTDPDPLGARCLDGTAPRVWIERSTSGSRKWVWHFQGGGWCESEESCAGRAFDPKSCMLGSSSAACYNNNSEAWTPLAPKLPFEVIAACNGARWCGGTMNSSSATNPLAHDWNKVLMNYCDGGSYSGNNATPTMVAYPNAASPPRPMYYRGYRNLNFALETLVKDWHLGDATEVLISGDSAGGLASYWHADRFQDFLGPDVFVAAAPDSGFFIGDETKPAWPAALQWIASAMNATAGLDASCVAAAVAAGKSPGAACTLPEDVAPHISVPLFVVNSKFDPAMISISSKSKTDAQINALATRWLALLDARVLNGTTTGKRTGQNGAFVSACNEHCGQWAQGQTAKMTMPNERPQDYNSTVDGITQVCANLMISLHSSSPVFSLRAHAFILLFAHFIFSPFFFACLRLRKHIFSLKQNKSICFSPFLSICFVFAHENTSSLSAQIALRRTGVV